MVWTGYVLATDGWVARLTGRSYLTTARRDLVLVVLASIGAWWLFEWYNAPRFWRGGDALQGLWWQYHAMEPNPFLAPHRVRLGLRDHLSRRVPHGGRPARERAAPRARSPLAPVPALLRASVGAGGVAVVLPLVVVSPWLAPLVWLGWALLLEPLNYRPVVPRGSGTSSAGDASRLLGLLASGAVCGVLWEFWNFWATTRWTYSVPYLGDVKVFEMPVLGYLGFPPFALECFAMYVWLRGRLGPERRRTR